MENTIMFNAGKAFVSVQSKLGVSNASLGELLDVAPNQVARWRVNPDMKMSVVFKVCKVGKIKLNDFIKLGS
jgi:hypothetical protein